MVFCVFSLGERVSSKLLVSLISLSTEGGIAVSVQIYLVFAGLKILVHLLEGLQVKWLFFVVGRGQRSRSVDGPVGVARHELEGCHENGRGFCRAHMDVVEHQHGHDQPSVHHEAKRVEARDFLLKLNGGPLTLQLLLLLAPLLLSEGRISCSAPIRVIDFNAVAVLVGALRGPHSGRTAQVCEGPPALLCLHAVDRVRDAKAGGRREVLLLLLLLISLLLVPLARAWLN